MVSRAKALRRIRDMAMQVPGEMEAISTMHSLSTEANTNSEPRAGRTIVIIATGILEHALHVAIKSKLVVHEEQLAHKIFDGDHEREGIIGNIYSRNLMARAFDVYGPRTYEDISSIRVIRNICAHTHRDVDLSSAELLLQCDFHAIGVIDGALELGRTKPKTAAAAVTSLLIHLVPYLILHSSSTWDEVNRSQWRSIFD